MNPINIYFFSLASFLAMESMGIVSQKASITIHPVEKTFEIYQEDLFSVIMTAADSLSVANELQQIAAFRTNVKKEFGDSLIVDEIVLSKNGQQLNAVLRGRYTDPKIMEEAGIYLDTATTGQFSMINIPEWNMQSADAVVKENYWLWQADKSVTIHMEPYKNIPDEYRSYRRSILPYWERQQENSQPK